MEREWRYLYYKLSEALAAGKLDAARRMMNFATTAEPRIFDFDDPTGHAFRLMLAGEGGNLAWLADAEACLSRNSGALGVTAVKYEGAIATHHLAGLMRLATDVTAAAAHFQAALRLQPDFLPALVELEILRTGRDRAAVFAGLGYELPRTDWRYRLAAVELGLGAPVLGAPLPGVAICLRGLCTPQTPTLLRLYRSLNPGAPLFLSTWNDTPEAILAPIREQAHVTLLEPPFVKGGQNKNLQLALARGVLSAAQGAGMTRALMLRTDMVLFSPKILNSLDSVHRLYPRPSGRLFGRIVIADIYTRKYMPLHPSDLLAYGALPDLLKLWGAPLTPPEENPTTTERYLGDHFLSEVGSADNEPPMKAYRRILRDYFIVRDFNWFEGHWSRQPELRNGADLVYGDMCVSQVDWERMYHADDLDYLDACGALDNGVVVDSTLGISRY